MGKSNLLMGNWNYAIWGRYAIIWGIENELIIRYLIDNSNKKDLLS